MQACPQALQPVPADGQLRIGTSDPEGKAAPAPGEDVLDIASAIISIGRNAFPAISALSLLLSGQPLLQCTVSGRGLFDLDAAAL